MLQLPLSPALFRQVVARVRSPDESTSRCRPDRIPGEESHSFTSARAGESAERNLHALLEEESALTVDALDSSSSFRILVVDDDPDILKVVRFTLEAGGFDVREAASGKEALESLHRNGLPHLALVDIMMPEMDGLELCREIQKFCDLPIIMLTAVNEEQTTVESIRQFAEDYITKPFRPQELLARVERVLRRIGDFSYALAPQVAIDDALSIDFARTTAIVSGNEVALTPTETKILYILARSAGRTVTTDFLLRRVWPLEEVFEDTLRVHVHRLRQKIEPDPAKPSYVVTKRGIGYAMDAPAGDNPGRG